jgi:hypothetical protein
MLCSTNFLNLLLLIAIKLNINIPIYIKQVISNKKPNALLDVINKYHAEECKSYFGTTKNKTS